MSDAAKYGKYRWGVLRFGSDEVDYVFADSCRVADSGALVLESADKEAHEKMHVRYAYAAGQWREVFAASLLDGGPVARD